MKNGRKIIHATEPFFEVSKNISFNIHYDHTIDYYRALPIDLYYYNLNLGIQINM